MALDIQVGHFQGVEGQIAQDHFGFGEDVGAGDADATGAGAKVEDARRVLRQPGGETLLDQLGDRRTGHQHALVDHEGHAAEPGLAEQIGHRHALFDAAEEQLAQVRAFVLFQATVQVAVGDLVRQVQSAQHQLAGLIPGIVGAMTEEQVFSMETADSPANVITQGAQAGLGHVDYLGKRAADSSTPPVSGQPPGGDERRPATPVGRGSPPLGRRPVDVRAGNWTLVHGSLIPPQGGQ
ncbi:hypothetical protein D3C76_860330 [compost metagenome]